jgi:hypothetical protein
MHYIIVHVNLRERGGWVRVTTERRLGNKRSYDDIASLSLHLTTIAKNSKAKQSRGVASMRKEGGEHAEEKGIR